MYDFKKYLDKLQKTAIKYDPDDENDYYINTINNSNCINNDNNCNTNSTSKSENDSDVDNVSNSNNIDDEYDYDNECYDYDNCTLNLIITFINKCIKYNNTIMLNKLLDVLKINSYSLYIRLHNMTLDSKFKYFYAYKNINFIMIFISKLYYDKQNIFLLDYLDYLKHKKSKHYYEIKNLLLLTYKNINLNYFDNNKLIHFITTINKIVKYNISFTYKTNYKPLCKLYESLDMSEARYDNKTFVEQGLFNEIKYKKFVYNTNTFIDDFAYYIKHISKDNYFYEYYNILLLSYFYFLNKKIEKININNLFENCEPQFCNNAIFDNTYIFYYYYVFYKVKSKTEKCISLMIYDSSINNFYVFIYILMALLNNYDNPYFKLINKYFIERDDSIAKFRELHIYLDDKNDDINIILFSKLIKYVANNVANFIISEIDDKILDDGVPEDVICSLKKYICIFISKLINKETTSNFVKNIISAINTTNLINTTEYLNYINDA